MRLLRWIAVKEFGVKTGTVRHGQKAPKVTAAEKKAGIRGYIAITGNMKSPTGNTSPGTLQRRRRKAIRQNPHLLRSKKYA